MKLTLRNFQSHKESVFDLVPGGVNAIIGLSRAGKSAVLRALDLLFNNKFPKVRGGKEDGDIFSSWWGGDTFVGIEFDDGVSVARIKGKNVNKYTLQIPGQPLQEFTGFNQSVPDAITVALMIHDVNMRFQHQGAFLLSKTPGEISRYLNQVAQIDVIDTTVAANERTLRKERGEAEKEKETAGRLTEELLAYAWLPEAEGALTILEGEEAKVAQETTRYNALFDLSEEIRRLEAEISPCRVLSMARPGVNAARVAWEGGEALKVRRGDLTLLRNEIRFNEGLREKAQKIILHKPVIEALLAADAEATKIADRADTLETLRDEIRAGEKQRAEYAVLLALRPAVQAALGVFSRHGDLFAKRNFLGGLAYQIRQLEKEGKTAQDKHLKLKAAFDKAMPQRCPLCGKPKTECDDREEAVA